MGSLLSVAWLAGFTTNALGSDAETAAARLEWKQSSFVTSHKIEWVSPGPTDMLTDASPAEVHMRVSFDRWPIYIMANAHLALPIVLDGKETHLLLDPSSEADAQASTVRSFCAANILADDNCAWLRERAGDMCVQHNKGLLGAADSDLLAEARLCLRVGVSSRVICALADQGQARIELPPLFAGRHSVELITAVKEGQFSAIEISSWLPGYAEPQVPPWIEVRSDVCVDASPPVILHPRSGALLGPVVELHVDSSIEFEARFRESSVCLSLDGTLLGCHGWPFESPAFLRDLTSGSHIVKGWWGTEADEQCSTSASFEVAIECRRKRADGVVRAAETLEVGVDGALGSRNRSDATAAFENDEEGRLRLLFVTGASQRYMDGRILQNLVGSIHHWEPQADLDIWDFGLNEDAKAEIRRWHQVSLRSLSALMPLHLHTPGFGAYAAKAWATLNALRSGRATSVLWVPFLEISTPSYFKR